MSQLQPVQPGCAGPPRLAAARITRSTRYVRLRLVGVSTGLNWTVNSNAHNEFRFGIQHSGDTNERGREPETFLLNGIVNGLAGTASVAASSA